MYRIKDIDDINKNIDTIKNDAIMKYKNMYEPTIKENIEVINVIQNYIKKNRRILYGGYAQHLLIKNKNPEDGIYAEIEGICFNFPEIADMEFYSPEPLEDIVKLTNELFNYKFKYIEAKEAVHGGTYKIFVNRINYCDFAYMPTNIYKNLPVININNFICCHPHFMLADAYRVFNDPFTSYWRLEKPLKRFQKVLQYYPIIKSDTKISNLITSNSQNNDILKYINKRIIKKHKLIVIGLYGFNYYMKKVNKNKIINISHYEVISIDLKNDVTKIYNKLNKKFKNITIVNYFQFYDFIDKSVEFYYNNKLILKVIGNKDICIVNRYSKKKKTYFGTNNLIFMYLLFNYFYYYINKNSDNTNLYLDLIKTFFHAKQEYLDKHDITVLNNSPFQDFTYDCIGEHVDILRKSYIEGLENLKNKKRFKFIYIPTGVEKKLTYVYPNCSGNKILNKNFFILKK